MSQNKSLDINKADIAKVKEFCNKNNTSVVVIFFDDMVGSCALKQKLGEERFRKLREEHDELLTSIIIQNGDGEVIKSTGDGLLAVFYKPSIAVMRALKIQEKLRDHQYIRIRIGMNMGEVRVEGQSGRLKDLFGMHVDWANRAMSIAEGGHIIVTRFVYSNPSNWINEAQVSWKPQGLQVVKEDEEPLELFEPYNANITSPMESLKVAKSNIDNVNPSSPIQPNQGDNQYSGKDVISTYQTSERAAEDMRRYLLSSREAILIGTGINLLHSATTLIEFVNNIESGKTKATICMANPFSRFVEIRLFEEELGLHKPDVGYTGLLNRIKTLLDCKKRMERNSDQFKILLFNHYPTIAILKFDQHVFFYPYGYRTLGNLSPAFYVEAGCSTGRFLNDQINLILKDATYAEDIIAVDNNQLESLSNQPHYAVFFVPAASHPLYKLGSKILGYNIRENERLRSEFTEYIGNAKYYGFHLTVSDALIAYNTNQLDWFRAELMSIAKRFERFSINYKSILRVDEFRDHSAIVIGYDDPTGNLEILHTEITTRFNSQSPGSNYTIDTSLLPNQHHRSSRIESMLKWYKAPFILKEYHLHFTLLSGLHQQCDRENIVERLNVYINQINHLALDIRVETICLMKKADDGYWHIDSEIKLGK